MRKRWVYVIQLILSILIIIMLAVGCAGSPSTSSQGSVITSKTVLFYIPTSINTYKMEELKVIKEWHGTESTVIRYNPNKSPWVINAYYEPTSKLQSSFSILVTFPTETTLEERLFSNYPLGFTPLLQVKERLYADLIKSDKLAEIKVSASGVEWTIKVGVE